MSLPSLTDLDRCEHGRHRKDRCFSCPDGWSTGNLILSTGLQIGWTLHGVPIVVPAMEDRSTIEKWIKPQ